MNVFKKVIYAVVYLAAFIFGAILLIFNHQTVEDTRPILHPVAIAAGIVFITPGICLLISSLVTHKDSNGVVISKPWFSTVMGIIALIWGVLLLIMPDGVFGNFNISLGVSVVIVGFAQLSWIVKGRNINGAPVWLYIIPVLAIVAGIYVLIIKTDHQNPGRELIQGSIIAGITLVAWALNGFGSLPRRKKTLEDIEKETKRLAEEQKKAMEDQAHQAKARLEEAKVNTEAAKKNEEEARKVAEEASKKMNAVKENAKDEASDPDKQLTIADKDSEAVKNAESVEATDVSDDSK